VGLTFFQRQNRLQKNSAYKSKQRSSCPCWGFNTQSAALAADLDGNKQPVFSSYFTPALATRTLFTNWWSTLNPPGSWPDDHLVVKSFTRAAFMAPIHRLFCGASPLSTMELFSTMPPAMLASVASRLAFDHRLAALLSPYKWLYQPISDRRQTSAPFLAWCAPARRGFYRGAVS
jgi:hypothetical protein